MNISNLNDIKQLIIDQIEEGLAVEYKKELGVNSDIAKEICAFANSNGGSLIYGLDSKDRIPISCCWIEGEAIEEKIHNIVLAYIQQKLEGVCISRYANPEKSSQAVFVIEVPKSPNGPHMSNYRYYKRNGSISSPMNHDEIKIAMLGPGKIAALRFEISINLNLLDKSYMLFERLFGIIPERRKRVALIPFHTDAWTSIIASGMLISFSDDTIKSLLEAYAIIHEINSLMEWLKLEKEPTVHTSAFEDSFKEHGTYIPSIIREKFGKLGSLLRQIEKSLN